MTTIVIPERRQNERYRPEYLEPTAEAQAFQTPYAVTKIGRFTVLIDRSLPGVRYGFCLEADPLGRPVPDVLCWASPYTPLERAEKSAQAAEVCKRFEGNDLDMTEAESLAYSRLVLGRVSLTVEDALTAHREAELSLGATPPAHLQALTPIEHIGLHYLDFPGGSR